MLTIGKTFTFEAAHYIEGHPTCGKLHGHTWTVDVFVRSASGKLDNNHMLIDFKVLGGIVRDRLNHLDHKVINERVNFAPTAETLACWLVQQIRFGISEVLGETFLDDKDWQFGVRLQEGPGGWAEYWEETK